MLRARVWHEETPRPKGLCLGRAPLKEIFQTFFKFPSGIIGKRPFLAKSWPGGASRSLPGAYRAFLKAFWEFLGAF